MTTMHVTRHGRQYDVELSQDIESELTYGDPVPVTYTLHTARVTEYVGTVRVGTRDKDHEDPTEIIARLFKMVEAQIDASRTPQQQQDDRGTEALGELAAPCPCGT